MSILTIEQISLQATATTKSDAIRLAGQVLVDNEIVTANYVEGMLMREETMSTYIGNGIAIPHGTYDHLDDILRTGISVVQIPEGVEWETDETAYLIIGIAAKSDEHMTILSNLAEAMEDDELVAKLIATSDPALILEHLGGQPEPNS